MTGKGRGLRGDVSFTTLMLLVAVLFGVAAICGLLLG